MPVQESVSVRDGADDVMCARMMHFSLSLSLPFVFSLSRLSQRESNQTGVCGARRTQIYALSLSLTLSLPLSNSLAHSLDRSIDCMLIAQDASREQTRNR